MPEQLTHDSNGPPNRFKKDVFGYADDDMNRSLIAKGKESIQEAHANGEPEPAYVDHIAEQDAIQTRWDEINSTDHPEGSLEEVLKDGGRDEVALHALGRASFLADPNATPEWAEFYDRETAAILREKQGKPAIPQAEVKAPESTLPPVEDLNSTRS